MQHLRVGTLLLASFKVAYRTGMWVLGGSYQLVRLMVAKPLEIGIAVVETPYIITRDVCKAFLPVYSFFTVAAVIGVIVGGSAMWIAHILISAIGADRDKSVMFIQSQTPPHLRLNDSAQVFRQRGKNTSKQPPQIAAASLSTGGLCNLLPRSKHGAGLQSSAAFRKGLGALSYDEDDDEEEEDDNEDEDDEDDGNWSVAKEEKRVKELFENAKRRAQRRKAFYDSRLGDPMQLLRVSGTAVRLVANPETYICDEESKNLMPWAIDPSIKIDRFDGRALLDFIPTASSAVIESGLRTDRDEDGIGNELRFQRWHDLVDKARLHVSEEKCLINNEEEWNDLVARHQALIGKVANRKQDAAETLLSTSFSYNYGAVGAQDEQEVGSLIDRELKALEEENIMDHLDELAAHDRNTLDILGAQFGIQDYYRQLRFAKQDEDARVLQLKVTAVNLERALAGKKPLKTSEIDVMLSSEKQDKGDTRRNHLRRRSRRHRASSPSIHDKERLSPSYEPYQNSPSRSDSESPKEGSKEFIMEFEVDESGKYSDTSAYVDVDVTTLSSRWRGETKGNPIIAAPRVSISNDDVKRAGNQYSSIISANSNNLSLAEKIKLRMRQGLVQSGMNPKRRLALTC
ncbi:hypothetical protein EDD11_003005 [Mortierella claussenii]|nr:hypothetical protein EDD11_003005 [Mortierella claussenii]